VVGRSCARGDRARVDVVRRSLGARRRAAIAFLSDEPEAALELADAALQQQPTHAAARWNRALALRDLGLVLAAAVQLEELAKAGEPGWSAEGAELARALRAPVAARRAARLDESARRRAALTGTGAPLTAADVASAPTTARHYFHDALRVAATAADLDALMPLASALDGQSGGDECARELARVRGLDLRRRARFAPRYRELVAGKLAPAEIDALLRDLAAAGPSVDDIRLGVIILGRRTQEQLAEISIVALSPLHGRPPPWKLGAWVWSTGRDRAAPPAAKRDVLVVAATSPPDELLDLPNLAPVPVPPEARGLTGADATPRRVADAMKTATYVELHAHGLVDLDIDDGGFIALSPDAGGDWRLTASDVRTMKLAGAPVVVLAACRAAEAAPDRLRRWSLPDAFLAADTRAVIAADVAVPDDLIRTFVDDVRGRIDRGEAPAQAAAAARAALIAGDAKSASWVDRLMVFE
jgi:hypothetical protein